MRDEDIFGTIPAEYPTVETTWEDDGDYDTDDDAGDDDEEFPVESSVDA